MPQILFDITAPYPKIPGQRRHGSGLVAKKLEQVLPEHGSKPTEPREL
jgi:hypothetical protein